MQITMNRFFVFPIFAAVLLSGCSSTLHPTITITPSSPQAGTSFVVTGMGFSPGSSCAHLSYTVNVGTTTNPSGTPVSINAQPTCNGGVFTLNWTPPQVSNCTANNTVYVNAQDITTGKLAGAPATAVILCEAAVCPPSLAVTVTGKPPNQSLALTSASMPQYFDSSLGPQGVIPVLNTGTCTYQCISSLTLSSTAPLSSGYINGVSQQGGFEQCTYQNPTTLTCPGNTACVQTLTTTPVTITFSCPDSGGCVGN